MTEANHIVHADRPELARIDVVAGMSPLQVDIRLNGEPWTGLVSFDFKARTGGLVECTAKFYANVTMGLDVREVRFTNAPAGTAGDSAKAAA